MSTQIEIGIDIDGVLVDTYMYLTVKGSEYFERKPVRLDTIRVKDMFNTTEGMEKAFWLRTLEDYVKNVPKNPGIRNLSDTLIETNLSHVLITRRFENLFSKSTMVTELKAHTDALAREWFPHCAGVIYARKSKIPAIEKFGIKVLIEDEIDNIKEVQDYCTPIKVRTCYNAFVDRHLFIEAKDLYQVAEMLRFYKAIKESGEKEREQSIIL